MGARGPSSVGKEGALKRTIKRLLGERSNHLTGMLKRGLKRDQRLDTGRGAIIFVDTGVWFSAKAKAGSHRLINSVNNLEGCCKTKKACVEFRIHHMDDSQEEMTC